MKERIAPTCKCEGIENRKRCGTRLEYKGQWPSAMHLELLMTVGCKVIVVIEPQRPIVVVDTAVSAAIVTHEEVVRDVAGQHPGARGDAVVDKRHIRLPVPAVYRAL